MNVVEVFGIVCCDNQERLVDVCSNDMALLREVRRLSDNIIPTVFYLSDESRSLLIRCDDNMVTNSHRIGRANSFQTEIALNLAIYCLAFLGFHRVPATCVLYY